MYARKGYYRPYESESDSDSQGTISGSSSDSEKDDTGPNFAKFATQLQLQRAGGPSFSSMQTQLFYQKPIAPNGVYSDVSKAYEPLIPPPPKKEKYIDYPGETITTDAQVLSYLTTKLSKAPQPQSDILQEAPKSKEKVNSIILLTSRDRDRQIYPQPTVVNLKLPREYRNVTNFQIMQMSLLTSFYFFRNEKENTDITIQEQDRTTVDKFGNTIPLSIRNVIRTGSYSINSLLTEIQKWLNNTPIFFDFINGFTDFQASFQSSGDFGVNFNEPGDFFFDTMQNDFISNPTKDLIVSKYWRNRYSTLTVFSVSQVRIAYYYPVLKEILLDSEYPNAIDLTYGLNIDPTITTIHEVFDRIIYTFIGIDDPVVLGVLNGDSNQATLDSYRLKHTFRNYLVNKYNPTLEAQSQQVIFTTTSLNTSLVNLLNIKQAQYYQEQFQLTGITSNQFTTLQNSINQYRAILVQMNSFEQSNLAKYFAIPFNTFTLDYFATLSNTVSIRNGLNAIGIPTGYSDPSYNPLTANPTNTNILDPLFKEPPILWPNMFLLDNTINYFSPNSENNHPFDVINSNISLNKFVINPSTNYLVPSLREKDIDVVTHISASKYTVFPFASPVRQTLQVETLYRPPEYRVPAYNQVNYNSTIQKFFDTSYAFVDPEYTANEPYEFKYDVIPECNVFPIPGWSPSNAVSTSTNSFWSWNRSLSTSLSLFSTPLKLSINTPNKSLYLKFTTPDSNDYNTSTTTLKYQLNVATYAYDLSGNIAPPKQSVRILYYKDRSAFMGDVYNVRKETPYSIYASSILDTTSTSIDDSFLVFPKQTFYMTIRPDPISFGYTGLKVVPYFTSSFSLQTIDKGLDSINPAEDSQYNPSTLTNFNYSPLYDPNFIPIPIRKELWTPDPGDDPNQSVILSSNVPIGYDASGVSNDLTDYMPFLVNKSTNFITYNVDVSIDPVTEYQFQCNSPYSDSAKSYFYPGSENSILVKRLEDVYSTIKNIPYRQEKIVHYYSLNYILSGWDVDHYAPYIYSNPVQLPYSQYTTNGQRIRGYEYAKNMGSNPQNIEYLSLGQGPCGFSFIPSEGVWDMDRVVFRSAFSKSSNNDPNTTIRYVGVYNTRDIYDKQLNEINMRSSILVLSNSVSRSYDPTDVFSLSAGFDATGGTYYEFQKMSNILLNNKHSTITGYIQDQGTMTNDPTNLFSVIAFDSNERPTTIKALSGSTVPFPYYSSNAISNVYIDGTPPPQSEFYDLIQPKGSNQTYWPVPGSSINFGPPLGYDGSQSVYQLSQPLGTSVTHFIDTKPLAIDLSGIFAYDLPFEANQLVATVKDYLLTQTSVYQIWYYQQVVRNLSLAWNFTGDLIYPLEEQTSILSVSGNSSEYVFLGGFNETPTTLRLRFKKFNPVSGLLQEYYTPSTFVINNDIQVNTFTFTNSNGFIFTGKTSSNVSVLYRSVDGSNLQTYYYSNVNIHHSQDASSNKYYWLKQDDNFVGSTIYQVNESNSFPGIEFNIVPQQGTQLPSTFRTLGTSLFRGQPYETAIDEIFMTSTDGNEYSSHFYSVYQLNSNTNQAIVLKSVSQFSNSDVSGSEIADAQFVVGGYNSSRWFMTNNYPFLWGNRNNSNDTIARVESAWQIFYPWQKITLRKIANAVNPITDLTGLGEPEYVHTNMFYYTNYTKLNQDIGSKWGLEQSTNFTVANVNFGGYAFNSYTFNVPLRASSNSSDLQYLALRNYLPTEESQVITRFVLPNKYSFGYITFADIAKEATLYKAGISNSFFDPTYARNLTQFDTTFSTTQSWGSNLIPNFSGCNLSFSNFGGFISTYSSYYKIYASNNSIINNIVSSVKGNVNTYIATQLKYILPPSALERQQSIDPLQFSIQWKTSLKPNYAVLTENWGLGYNLGYYKVDTPYGTVQKAQSFYKIIDDYIYLRLNPESDMNRLDFGGREDHSITLEPTGATKTYYGKLLLNNFNSYSQTFVQNGVAFNPPLSRLDQLSFTWLNFSGDVIDNDNCEWNISVQVTEEVTKLDKPPQITSV